MPTRVVVGSNLGTDQIIQVPPGVTHLVSFDSVGTRAMLSGDEKDTEVTLTGDRFESINITMSGQGKSLLAIANRSIPFPIPISAEETLLVSFNGQGSAVLWFDDLSTP